MKWELIEAVDIECTMDNSGVHTVINRLDHGYANKGGPIIRVDIMNQVDEPLVSYQGEANAVRKAVIAWLTINARWLIYPISSERASYIGYEIMRAQSEENYVQA